MTALPTGTVTFLFTDIEGSTRLVRDLGDRWDAVLGQHNAVIRQVLSEAGGTEVTTEGDAFFAVFESAPSAVAAAVASQRALQASEWPADGNVRVRMGLHTGQGRLGGDNYVGIDVHRAARISAAGHGGQVLLSETTRSVAQEELPPDVSIRDLGRHRLKDFPEAQDIFELVISGLPSDFPPIRTLEVPTNLPLQLTSFVGREDEREKLRELLRNNRLLTLTGPGGTGKTRLALQTAADSVEDFRDGVFFVDLAPIIDPRLVTTAIADALKVREEPNSPIMETLKEHVGDKSLLLVLDNFEQVLDAAAELRDLLASASKLKALVTSRVRLSISGEQEFPVMPLPGPDPKHLPGDALHLTRFDSVALFIERAKASAPAFQVTDDDAPAVAEIVFRLDGLPLAIELAASRVKLLPPQQLLSRLGQRLPLLSGARDLPERQRTLRGAIGWSYDLLDSPERHLFARASVFRGGCSLDAAEEVCNPGADLGIDTLDGVASLVDNSLLRKADSNGDARFGMLETIREFATERLRREFDADATALRYAERMARLTEEAEPHLELGEPGPWLELLDHEHDNVRGALDWCIETGNAELAMRIAASFWRFWQQRGHFFEGRETLERVLHVPAAQAVSPLRGKTLLAAGSVAYWQQDYPTMKRYYDEGYDVYMQTDDREGQAVALQYTSFGPWMEGDIDSSLRMIEEALDLFRELGNEQKITELLGYEGYLYSLQGNHAKAIAPMEESIVFIRRSGGGWALADSLAGLGNVYRLAGRLEESKPHFREGLSMFHDFESEAGIAMTLDMVAALAAAEGKHERALRLAGAADAIKDRLGGGAPEEMIRVGDVRVTARDALGDDTVERVWQEGRSMSVDEAVALALED